MAFSLKKCPATVAERRRTECVFVDNGFFDLLLGKTVSESFSSAAELHKAQREVEAFHRFQQLSQELLEVNEKICRARPVADTVSPQEKKRRKPSARKSRAN